MTSIPDAQSDLSSEQRGGSTSTLRVPQGHGSVFVSPSWTDSISLTRRQHLKLPFDSSDIQGMSISKLREWARTELIQEAQRYTSNLLERDVVSVNDSAIIVTGHQPEPFHAGVWAKNFAASHLAQTLSGTSINLIVDNDTIDRTSIRVPIRDQSSIRIQQQMFDTDRPSQPWEDAQILDRNVFCQFGDDVINAMRHSWSFEPMLARHWNHVVKQLPRFSRLCDALTYLRAICERENALTNLELPMSRVCESKSFRWFAACLIIGHTQVHAAYNESVHRYRDRYRLKSTSHPVPDLDHQQGWYEIPFWVWRNGDRIRDRPFVRVDGHTFQLRDRNGIFARWTQSTSDSAQSTAAVLEQISNAGIRFRTRALTTTLFVRMCLADLFIHGIGGAKYDEMTDELSLELFKQVPPRFLTVSATYHLPLHMDDNSHSIERDSNVGELDTGSRPIPAVTNGDDLNRIEHSMRDVRYNPDRHRAFPEGSLESSLARDKYFLLSNLNGHRPSSFQTKQIQEINRKLLLSSKDVVERLQQERESIRLRIHRTSIQTDREFPWFLFPHAELIPKLHQVFSHPRSDPSEEPVP